MLQAHLDKEISLLEVLKMSPSAAQRDMAEALGLSLGMTNLLLKEISAKGWMLMRRLSARKVQYILTPDGLSELASRSYRYLKRSIRSIADCRTQVEKFLLQLKENGYEGCCLVGKSDLEFVFDYLCRVHGLEFRTTEECGEKWFCFFSENESPRSPNLLEYIIPSGGTSDEPLKRIPARKRSPSG